MECDELRKIQSIGDGLVIHANVFVSSGCKVEDDEFEITFTGFSGPASENDIELATACIKDKVLEFGLKEETYALITLREDGEREGFSWHKYYLVDCFSLHNFDGENI